MSAHFNAHAAAQGAHHPSDGRQWVVLLSPDTRRMMSTLEVQAEVSGGTLSRETLVWRAGMSEWMALGHIRELDVPFAPPQRAPAATGWDAPVSASHHHAGHAHARPQPQRRVSNAEILQELVTTSAVAAIVIAMTLYLLALGGAFAPGTAAPGAAHAASLQTPPAQSSSAQQAH